MPRVLRPALAVVALLLSLLIVPAAAGAAPTPGNSDAAKLCQDGGYASYTRTDGTRFTNTGDCVSYAARGGMLVSLPDLLLSTSCVPDATAHAITCTFTVTNIGVAPATGATILLQAQATAQEGYSSFAGGGGTCTYVNDPNNRPTFTNPPSSGSAGYASATCAGPLNPGEQLSATVTVGVGTQDAGATIVISAAVDPNNLIRESNENNNTYQAVIAAP